MSSSAASVGGERDAAPLAPVPVICGATASGKSAIAMWLSGRRAITIISADSRQIYRDFDIGTAKPGPDDRARVPHRGVDVVEATQRYSAAAWADMARQAIEEALDAGRLPVVVGGTGFYIAALMQPLWAQPTMDAARRGTLQRALDAFDTDELRRWTATLDPSRAALGRAQLLRAVEVALLSGERLSAMQVARARAPLYQPSYLLVDPGVAGGASTGAAPAGARIAARAAAMFEAGWPDEVRRLVERVPEDAPAWNATGYDVVRQYVRGTLDRSAALERVVIETRQYAKRQRTWFRHQLEPERVTRVAPGEAGWQEIVDRWITDVEANMRTSHGDRAR